MKKYHMVVIGLVIFLCAPSSVNAFVVQRHNMQKLMTRIHTAEKAQRPRIAAEFVADVINISTGASFESKNFESYFQKKTTYTVQDFVNVLNAVFIVEGLADMFVAVNDAGALIVCEPISITYYQRHEETAAVQGEAANNMDAVDGASLELTDQAKHKELFKAGGLYLVIDLSEGPEATHYPVSHLDAVPEGGWTDKHKTTNLVMRRISAGTFIMGSPDEEVGRDDDETQRQVTLTKDYYIGVFPVTQKQWERVMGDWPSYYNNTSLRDSRPVEQRSWNDIRGGIWPGGAAAEGTFMQRIGARTGLDFDLPTEAQWEYACRAGTTTALNSGKNLTSVRSCPNMLEVGRYWYNDGSVFLQSAAESVGTAKVGSYLPNAWDLFDMHGNVWEWCLDWYSNSYSETIDPAGAAKGETRVIRGGSWREPAQHCRAAKRNHRDPSYRDHGPYGFRVGMTIP